MEYDTGSCAFVFPYPVRRPAMLVEVGPASVVVTGYKDGRFLEFTREEIEDCLAGVLTDVRDYLPVLRQKGYRIKRPSSMPGVAIRMAEAVKAVDEFALTPMAAVAGAVADVVKERLKEKDADFISVNNGGDISLFNRSGRTVRIGIGDIGKVEAVPRVLGIRGLIDYGLATSGFGGRSFTLGLADTATVVARTGAIADAAATLICNETNVETDRVVRRMAREIDPCSDIADEWVTAQIGDLDDCLIGEALQRGLASALALKGRNLIFDAVITLRGRLVSTLDGRANIYMEGENGDKKACHNCGGYLR